MLMPDVDPKLDALNRGLSRAKTTLCILLKTCCQGCLAQTIWKLWSIRLEAICFCKEILVNCTAYDMYYAVARSGLTQWLVYEWRLLPGFWNDNPTVHAE